MALSSFILAKVASLPLMLLYVFIGASAGALIGHKKNDKDATTTAGTAVSSSDEFKSIEENTTLIVSGILLSFVMIAGITHNIRKELNKILERQEKHKPGEKESSSSSSTSNNTATSQLSSRDLRVKESAGGGDDDGGGDEEGMEMGSQLVRQRRAGWSIHYYTTWRACVRVARELLRTFYTTKQMLYNFIKIYFSVDYNIVPPTHDLPLLHFWHYFCSHRTWRSPGSLESTNRVSLLAVNSATRPSYCTKSSRGNSEVAAMVLRQQL